MSLRNPVTVDDLLDLVGRQVEINDQLGRYGLVRISLAARGDLFCGLAVYERSWRALRQLLRRVYRTQLALPSIAVALDMLRGFVLGAGARTYEPHHQVLEAQLAAIRALGIREWVLRSSDPQHLVARVALEREEEERQAHRLRAASRRRFERREARIARGIARRPA